MGELSYTITAGRFACPVCGSRFETVGLKKKHIRNAHTNEPSNEPAVVETTECTHEGAVEFEEGNLVPPYGYETYPGFYCHDCGEMIDDELAKELMGGYNPVIDDDKYDRELRDA